MMPRPGWFAGWQMDWWGTREERRGGNPSMNEREKWDRPVLPVKLPNNAARAAAEAVREGAARGDAASKTRPGRSAGQGAPSALGRVRRIAVQEGGRSPRSCTRRHRSPQGGVLGACAQGRAGGERGDVEDYGQDLEENLRDLHARVHGCYRAKPSRRAYIPKADGRLRPLGISALEDKLLQRAVVEVLNAVYESDFLGFSYGFRPGRGQHQTLDALAVAIEGKRVNWVLDADIRSYFDTIDRAWMFRFLEHRIATTGFCG